MLCLLQGSDAGREARVGGGLLASRCHSSGKQAVLSKHIHTLAVLHASAGRCEALFLHKHSPPVCILVLKAKQQACFTCVICSWRNMFCGG